MSYYTSYASIRQLYFNTALSSKHRQQLTDRADLNLNSRPTACCLLAEFKTAGEDRTEIRCVECASMREEGDEFAGTHCGGLGLC
jgi:hypothetical protein